MTNTKYLSSMKEMVIDETKKYATYSLEQQNQDLQKAYSDHNLVLLKIYFHIETIQTKEYKITTKAYKEQLEFSKVIAAGQIQNSYDKLCEVVEQSIKKTCHRNRIRQTLGKTVNENEEHLKKRTEPVKKY